MLEGLGFKESNHIYCGILGDKLMARVGPNTFYECFAEKRAREMDFNGKTMKGMVYVAPEGRIEDADFVRWIDMCGNFVKTVPPKH